MSERARIALLRAHLDRETPGVRVGIGDDAAVLARAFGPQASTRELVWTIDAQVDGVHFRRDWLSWEDVGWRSFMAAASDLGAMGAEPLAALSALVLAKDVTDDALDALARGQAAASLAVGAPVVGGNLSRGTETSLTTTLLGSAERPVLRAGARPGDGVWLAGPVGLAAAGLRFLAAQPTAARDRQLPSDGERMHDAHVATCIEAWRRPLARLEDGRTLAGKARAAIDVSDGLAHDAWQLAEASDVTVVLDARVILGSVGEALVRAGTMLGEDPLDLALHGGEDYALLATSSSDLAGFVRIGEVVARDGVAGSRGHLLLSSDGATRALDPRGFDHFA